MFQSIDIKYVKNVKRDSGTGWAYMDYQIGEVFPLNFSKKTQITGTYPKQGDLILIFQTIKNISGYRNGLYLTHLVTPVEDGIRKDPTITHKFPYVRNMLIIAYTPLQALKNRLANLNFFPANRGYCNRIELINTGGETLEQMQTRIWDYFDEKSNISSAFDYITTNATEEDEEALEGMEKRVFKMHKYYERNSSIVLSKKAEAIESNSLICEGCKFRFSDIYGQHGATYIECHHKNPISVGGVRVTRKEDLALVCSNCHRMLHRKNDLGKYYTVEELRELILKNYDNR